jgi:DNA-binding transcriptional MerR regulator
MLSQKDKNSQLGLPLPPIPDKIYFSIGEISRLCRLKPHVLRYWEQEFPDLSPKKRRGNRRYYQQKEVLLVRRIRHLLYEEGYTIDGARQQLKGLPAASHSHEIVAALKDIVALLDS